MGIVASGVCLSVVPLACPYQETALTWKEWARLARHQHVYLAARACCGDEKEATFAVLCLSARGGVARLGEGRLERQCPAIHIGYDDATERQAFDSMHRGKSQSR